MVVWFFSSAGKTNEEEGGGLFNAVGLTVSSSATNMAGLIVEI